MKPMYDVLVIGGGFGGVSAAVAAAKAGARTALVERYGCLGGMAVTGLVNPFMNYFLADGSSLASPVFHEVLDRLADRGALADDACVFDDEQLKFVFDDMVAHYGVDVLFHTSLLGVEVEDGAIKEVQLLGKEGPFAMTASIYIDSTGDGDLAAFSGCSHEVGREEDGLCQPMTLCFRVGGVTPGRDVVELRRELTAILDQAKAEGLVNQPRENVLLFPTLQDHIWHFNTTRIVGRNALTSKGLTEAELEARRQVDELFSLFKLEHPDFHDAFIAKIAIQTGVRESRRILGQKVLTAQEVLDGTKFDDGIARSNYDIDIHNPAGTGTVIRPVREGTYYEIPYGCLVPQDISNLLVGSRCISSTHEAHSSLRIMPVVSGIGEAAGLAAALCVEEGTIPQDVDGKRLKQIIFHSKEN